MNRRRFIAFSVIAASIGYSVGQILPKSQNNRLFLRPPGAVENFEALCIKCGQCIQVCPYHSIDLLDITNGYSNGTSYIDANKRGCYLCDLFPCVLACPSGALDHATTKISDVSMGVGVIKDFSTCLAYNNKKVNKNSVEPMLNRKIYNEREEAIRQNINESIDKECNLCVSLCPIGESAIVMSISKDGKNLPEFKDKCVGCGVCAEVCPIQIISIIPNKKFSEIYKESV